ncbi:putative leucine-rich repeat-containing protein DDB_G0290503 isoform X2 [Mytilus edulis]|uniref:putative leucine-rich repeat-containing protein DDB_G0290503 isoform X2 n=1 Tax=Mytilus edulis TaxID=6550 RepID=UPI0039F0FBC0
MASEIEQDTSNRTKEKAVKTIELIKSFTGELPKDFRLIADIQELIENTIHQRSLSTRGDECHLTTIATDDGSLFEKLSDWSTLPSVEKNNHKNFLEENYSPEDLQLAYDEYFARHGRIPALRDFRVFILQWQVEMQQKNIDLESDNSNLNLNQENFRLALDHAVHVSTEQQNQLQNLITDRVNLQRRFEQAIDTAEQLNTINVQHVTNNGLLQNECTRLIGENNQVNTRCNRLHQDNRRKDMQIVGLDKEIVQLIVQVAEKETNLKQKDTTIEHLTSQNEQQSTTIEQQGTTIEQKDTTIEHLTSQNKEKDGKIKDMKCMNKKLYSDLQEKQELCVEKDRQLKKQCLVIDELHVEMSATNERLANLEKGLEKKNKHISEQDKMISDLNDKVQSQDKVNQDLFEQLLELKNMLLTVNQRQEAAESNKKTSSS